MAEAKDESRMVHPVNKNTTRLAELLAKEGILDR
jgi:hypothetical protein